MKLISSPENPPATTTTNNNKLTKFLTMISEPESTARWRGARRLESSTLEFTLACTLIRNSTLSMSLLVIAMCRKLRPLLSTWRYVRNSYSVIIVGRAGCHVHFTKYNLYYCKVGIICWSLSFKRIVSYVILIGTGNWVLYASVLFISLNVLLSLNKDFIIIIIWFFS